MSRAIVGATALGRGDGPVMGRERSWSGHEYLLKFLLVGDSDVGKNEILDLLDSQEETQRLCSLHAGAGLPRETVILLEGRAVRLQLWEASGQGRLGTILRSYSRGAQGVLLVFDLTSRWSFDGIQRWLRELDELAPGIPKILLGNRLHLEFNRQVSREEAEAYAHKRKMEYFEVSTLASFNVHESVTELSRLVLSRNGMERLWKGSRVLSLQESACRAIVRRIPTVHDVQRLPLPPALQAQLSSYADSAQLTGAAFTLPRSGAKHRRTLSHIDGLPNLSPPRPKLRLRRRFRELQGSCSIM